MPTSDRDIQTARVLLEDALQVADVLPDSGDGERIKDDMELAQTFLDPDSSDADKAAARARATSTVHPSNTRKLP